MLSSDLLFESSLFCRYYNWWEFLKQFYFPCHLLKTLQKDAEQRVDLNLIGWRDKLVPRVKIIRNIYFFIAGAGCLAYIGTGVGIYFSSDNLTERYNSDQQGCLKYSEQYTSFLPQFIICVTFDAACALSFLFAIILCIYWFKKSPNHNDSQQLQYTMDY